MKRKRKAARKQGADNMDVEYTEAEVERAGSARCLAASEDAEDYLRRAETLISNFEYDEEDEYGEVIDEETLLTELYCIHDKLLDCDEDGWDGYRDAMDALSNRLWQIGVAWPQSIPLSWADEVHPEDLKMEISPTCLYREDLLAIREFSDNLKCTFKEAVHMMVEHARNTLAGFPKKMEKVKVKKKQSSRGNKKISRRRT